MADPETKAKSEEEPWPNPTVYEQQSLVWGPWLPMHQGHPYEIIHIALIYKLSL